MSEETYKGLVEQGLSTYKIAEALGIGQTTARYYLRKFGLNTRTFSHSKELKNCKNGKRCVQCDSELTGARIKYCSNECKGKKINSNTIERQKKVYYDRKIKIIEMAGGKCQLCGYDKNYAVLQFHHRDPENKTFPLNARLLSNTNWDNILSELEKCDLLCANCHIETHHPDKVMLF